MAWSVVRTRTRATPPCAAHRIVADGKRTRKRTRGSRRASCSARRDEAAKSPQRERPSHERDRPACSDAAPAAEHLAGAPADRDRPGSGAGEPRPWRRAAGALGAAEHMTARNTSQAGIRAGRRRAGCRMPLAASAGGSRARAGTATMVCFSWVGSGPAHGHRAGRLSLSSRARARIHGSAVGSRAMQCDGNHAMVYCIVMISCAVRPRHDILAAGTSAGPAPD